MFKVEKLNSEETYSALSIHNYAGSLRELRQDGFTPMTVKTLAEHRINLGAYHEISWTGSRTTDFFIYRNDTYYLGHADLSSDDTLTLLDSLQDFNANRTEIPFVKGLVKKVVEMPKEDMIIPTTEFDLNPVTKFLFGGTAADYGAWLDAVGIKFFPIALPPYSLVREHESLIRPVIMRCTDNWSGLITANADLHTMYGFRGSSTKYGGVLTSPETFSREVLEPVNKLVSLEDRAYGLPELETLIGKAGYAGLLNGLLRMARNGGHSLPANYDTFVKD